jgi:hypothetical protein
MRLHDDECYCGWCGNGPKIEEWLNNPMGKPMHGADGSVTAYCPNCGSLVSMRLNDGKLVSFGPAGNPDNIRPDFVMATNGRGVTFDNLRGDLPHG